VFSAFQFNYALENFYSSTPDNTNSEKFSKDSE